MEQAPTTSMIRSIVPVGARFISPWLSPGRSAGLSIAPLHNGGLTRVGGGLINRAPTSNRVPKSSIVFLYLIFSYLSSLRALRSQITGTITEIAVNTATAA